jgi:O-antigen/teichoic acid export membrane protein
VVATVTVVSSQLKSLGRWFLHSRHGVAAIAQTIATKFLLTGINVGTGIITARFLGVTGRGELSAMTLWPLLVPYLLTLGLPQAVRYCVRKAPERKAELFTVSLLVSVLLSIAALAVGVAIIPAALHLYPTDIVHGAQILMIFAPEVMLSLVLTAMLEALGEFKLANSTRYVPALMTLVSLTTLALSHKLTPFLGAASYLAPPVATAVWTAWKLRHLFRIRSFDPRRSLRELFFYGTRCYAIDVLGALSAQIDQVLVVGILSATAMGVYVVAVNASRVLQNLHSAVVIVVFPSASGLDPANAIAMVGRAARISTSIAIIFATAFAVVLPVLIPLLYGPGFDDAVRVGQLLIYEAVVGGLVYVLSQAFMACGRPALITALEVAGFLVVLPLMLILMPRFGLMGAAIALFISTVARLTLLMASFPVFLKVPVPNLLPNLDDLMSFRRALRAT